MAELRKLAQMATPAAVRAVRAGLHVIEDRQFQSVMRHSEPGVRASLLASWRYTMKLFHDGHHCDFCKGKAESIRFLLMRRSQVPDIKIQGPNYNCGIFFAVLCAAHDKRVDSELIAHTNELGRDRIIDGSKPYYRPVALGLPIGQAPTLPPRRALATCEECTRDIWINQDEVDFVGNGRDPVSHICVDCAEKLAAKDRLCAIPTALTDIW
jgi:hypothetical protein